MKRIVAAVLCLLLLCGCAAAPRKEDGRLRIVTTVFPLYDFVRAVGADKVETVLLIDAGMEIHSFDPAPSDLRAIATADLFMMVGGESETWAKRLIRERTGETLKMMDAVSLLPEEDFEHHEHHADGEEEFDEHIWTSLENAADMVETIARKLCAMDEKNARFYQQNADRYMAQILDEKREIEQIVGESRHPFILVADRYPFRYFAEEFGLEHEAAFGGCAASADIGARTMARLIRTVKEQNCTVAYYTELSNRTVADALAQETGVRLLELHSAHNVTKEDFENGVTYVDLMKRNAESLRKGLLS